jgi:hypothetical protein
MEKLGWIASDIKEEHLQNLVSQGYMTVVELATCHVPEDPTSLFRWGDTLWQVWHSMSGDLVCHHTDISVASCSSMAWNYIT